MAEINWKAKYTELKAKYMSDVDTAYRLGCEQGMQMAQQQQMQDQQAQQQAMEQAQAGGQEQPGQPGQEAAQQGQEQPDSAHPQGSELDQHISTLEGMLGKSELTEDDIASIQKSIANIKFASEMKKSDLAVRNIAKALAPKAPFKISNTAEHNLKPSAKAAVNAQEQIVSNLMKAWDEQEKALSSQIGNVLSVEGLKKD